MSGKPTVDEYIAKQPSPQREVCMQLRSILLDTFPDIKEQMKLGVPWYEGLFYIVSLKDHVNLGFALDHLPSEEAAKLKGGGKTMKCLEFKKVSEINKQEIIRLLKIVSK
jgi:hypothetical protein